MELLAIHTPLLEKGTDLPSLVAKNLKPGDIVAVSSKAAATVEGAAIDLKKISPGAEAKTWAERLDRSDPLEAAFRQAVIDETARMHGHVLDSSVYAMLTELRPNGLQEGTILAVNAGLDRSNTLPGHAIGWPSDPVMTARRLRLALEKKVDGRIGLLLTDSCCRPRRIGVTAMALTVSGFPPLISLIGQPDLFAKDLRMTYEATADQLATAANFLMGNAAESVPAVIIRDHGLTLTDDEGWVPGIRSQDDLFQGLFSDKR